MLAVVAMSPSSSAARTSPPNQIRSAKTIYIVNQTGNDDVSMAAVKLFTSWGRFVIASSESDADLIIVFSHRDTMDKWGNIGKTVMEVFPRGDKKPAYTTTSALHLIYDPQHPTKACIAHFREEVEAKK
jgi:hypothetical protein